MDVFFSVVGVLVSLAAGIFVLVYVELAVLEKIRRDIAKRKKK